MILAGRRINDNMSIYVSSRIIKLMLSGSLQPKESKILILGLAFKENCPDVRNTKVVDIISELGGYGAQCDVYDPWVDAGDAKSEYGIELIAEPEKGAYDVVVVAVAHRQFQQLGAEGVKAFGKEGALVYDIKYLLSAEGSHDRL